MDIHPQFRKPPNVYRLLVRDVLVLLWLMLVLLLLLLVLVTLESFDQRAHPELEGLGDS